MLSTHYGSSLIYDAICQMIARKIVEKFPARTGIDSDPKKVIVTFNDHELTTPADVLAVCEEAGV